MSGTSQPIPVDGSIGRSAPAPRSSRRGISVVAIVVVVIAIVTGLSYYELVVRPGGTSSTSGPLESGGFTQGQVVTFVYNGTDTYQCTPSITTLYPGNATASAAAARTPCEIGAANQSAVLQVPQWLLVPAFAGASVFGIPSLGASARGFPVANGTSVPTDCGAGGTPTACADHPTYLYAPLFTSLEKQLNLTSGADGLPLGVLPTPAHDLLLNTTPTYPNVPWGTIVVFVMDPNIFPDRATGVCTTVTASNLSSPTANCLTSITALDAALTTCSGAAAQYNAANQNPVWQVLRAGCDQVVVPGDLSVGEINNLNGNLYIPFAVQPGAPSSFPS